MDSKTRHAQCKWLGKKYDDFFGWKFDCNYPRNKIPSVYYLTSATWNMNPNYCEKCDCFESSN